MLKKVFYQYKHAKVKYTNYQLVKKVGKKAFYRIYHSINERIVYNVPIDLPSQYFNNFIPFNNFYFDSQNKQTYIAYLHCFKLRDEVINQANEVCEHKFNLLGSGKIFIGEKINWHKDFKSDFVWQKKYYTKISTVDLNNNADIKVPWELSRFQHIPTLGQAYWITNDSKYAIEFRNEIKDWIKENPVAIGVNWACTMDIAIRAVNWIIGYYYFKDCETIEKSFWTNFFKNLYLTGRFILKNLENDVNSHGNNHYLADLVGLVWIGIFFDGFDNNTCRWLNKGLKSLEQELSYQINSEGTSFEASIPYHRLVTEMILSTTILAEKSKIQFTKTYKQTLEKMCDFVMCYTKHNGLAPQIGDADDGRLHVFTHYGVEEKRDHRHILGIAGEHFNRDDFRYFAGNEKMDAVWLMGEIKDYCYKPQSKLITKQYKEMGYFIIRDERIYIVIRCGSVGQAGIGGHSHNDQLSIELQIDGSDIFVDPGTFVYTSDYIERNSFRSTESHNTLQIMGQEQNNFDPKQLFRLFDQTKSKLVSFEQNSNEFSLVAEHQGYMDKCGSIHRRELIYNSVERKIIIKDFISKPIQAMLNWTLAPNRIYQQTKARNLRIDNKINVFFNHDFCMRDTYVSPSYGVKVKSKKIVVESLENIETCIIF